MAGGSSAHGPSGEWIIFLCTGDWLLGRFLGYFRARQKRREDTAPEIRTCLYSACADRNGDWTLPADEWHGLAWD